MKSVKIFQIQASSEEEIELISKFKAQCALNKESQKEAFFGLLSQWL